MKFTPLPSGFYGGDLTPPASDDELDTAPLIGADKECVKAWALRAKKAWSNLEAAHRLDLPEIISKLRSEVKRTTAGLEECRASRKRQMATKAQKERRAIRKRQMAAKRTF